MTVTPEVQKLIYEEESILTEVLESLRQQMSDSRVRLQTESIRARELTTNLVAAARDVDKQLLASDEAVSHQLRDAKKTEVDVLGKLLEKPYFARVVVDEQQNGRTVSIEYKLGTAANVDCRIIDWRKAPIARLYYEYQEGDEYEEVIQDRERSGIVKTRNRLGIRQCELQKVSCRYGDFVKRDGSWDAIGSGYDRDASSYASLRSIVSLITPDQFRMITEDADSAVLIQGIAGSGKTTVALHRLAWLLHEDNADLKPAECVVLVSSRALQSYISAILPQLNMEGVAVLTFSAWCSRMLRHLSGSDTLLKDALAKPRVKAPPGVERVKRSFAMLRALEECVAASQADIEPQRLTDLLLRSLQWPERLLQHDNTSLLDRDLIKIAYEHTANSFAAGCLDAADEALLLRICQIRQQPITDVALPGAQLRHIVADEVQELAPAELDVIIHAVTDPSQLTLVGDTGQQSNLRSQFLGWDLLRSHPKFEQGNTVFATLTVSHRSTLPIMRLADHVGQTARTTEGRQGKPPIWFKCRSENEGVRQALGWLERVLSKFSDSIVAVICRSAEEARHVVTLLKPTFGSAVRLGDEHTFTFQDGIVVSAIVDVKGLEFPNVLLWNPSHRAFPPGELSRKLLYVGITRAEEHLCIVSWGNPSRLLPGVHSKLVRGYELEVDEER